MTINLKINVCEPKKRISIYIEKELFGRVPEQQSLLMTSPG